MSGGTVTAVSQMSLLTDSIFWSFVSFMCSAVICCWQSDQDVADVGLFLFLTTPPEVTEHLNYYDSQVIVSHNGGGIFFFSKQQMINHFAKHSFFSVLAVSCLLSTCCVSRPVCPPPVSPLRCYIRGVMQLPQQPSFFSLFHLNYFCLLLNKWGDSLFLRALGWTNCLWQSEAVVGQGG